MRTLKILGLVATAATLAPAAAHAQQAPTITLDPNQAGKASRLTLDASPGEAAGQGVRSIVLSAARGFKVDPRSRAKRCSADQASRFACPRASRIGTGEVKGHATGAALPGGRYDFTAQVQTFLAPPQQSGDVAGVVLEISEPGTNQRGSVTGRIVRVPSGPFGLELRFEGLDQAIPAFPGVTITIDRITLSAGARRTVVRKRRVRRGGRRVTVRRRVTYNLIRNPGTCSGSWPFQLKLGYADREDVTDGSTPCRAR
jgi:hypothetical protein